MSAQEAWAALCESKSGEKKKTEIKNGVLFHSIRGGKKWAERIEKQVQTLKSTEKREVSKQEFTRAELEIIHGLDRRVHRKREVRRVHRRVGRPCLREVDQEVHPEPVQGEGEDQREAPSSRLLRCADCYVLGFFQCDCWGQA
eukprot:2252563-Pyramimonas_sp.AAC.1